MPTSRPQAHHVASAPSLALLTGSPITRINPIARQPPARRKRITVTPANNFPPAANSDAALFPPAALAARPTSPLATTSKLSRNCPSDPTPTRLTNMSSR
ncbi:hypothetical protein PMIN07_002075 [Paraphaeosphaeria minitans]